MTTPEWKTAAWEAILHAAHYCKEFTTDEVWLRLDRLGIPTPEEPRAMGPMMLRAVNQGICSGTDRVRRSRRVQCHRRPVAVYVSLKAGPEALELTEDKSLFAPRIVITQPTGDCDGSKLYLYNPDTTSDGRGPKLLQPCSGCRACQ